MKGKLVVRVTVLNGSPRGDDETVKLIAWVVEGCLEARAHVNWIDLAGLDIRPCRRCLSCLRIGACPENDHVPAVTKRLLDADGIVVGSPAYSGDVSPELKTLAERLTFHSHYMGSFDDKRALGVAAGDAASAKEAARIFGRRFAALTGRTTDASGRGVLVDEDHQPRLAGRARKLGRRFVERIRRSGRLSLSSVWHRLRRMSIKRRLVRDPYTFRAVIAGWKEKGWLR